MTTKNIHTIHAEKIQANEIKEISISARRWFQSSYGNTYHSVEVAAVVSRQTAHRLDPIAYPLTERNSDVWIDLARNPFEYGYERHCETTALKMLLTCVSDSPSKWLEYAYICQVAADLDIPYSENIYDVKRKKDL